MYRIVEMDAVRAAEISCWRYSGPYEMYSFDQNEEEIAQLMNGLHFAVLNEQNETAGFLAIGWSAQVQARAVRKIYQAESFTDVAVGLRPDLCGKGLGKDFLTACLAYVKKEFPEDGIRLTVSAENERAYRLYRTLGFAEQHRYCAKVTYTAADGKKRKVKKQMCILVRQD